MAVDLDLHPHPTWPPQIRQSYPYSPSATSNASSTSSSAFSIDAPSSQSSVASSVGWSSSRWQSDSDESSASGYQFSKRRDPRYATEESSSVHNAICQRPQTQTTSTVFPAISRQHPRRTQKFACQSQDGNPASQCPRPPPSLVRQSERKDNFVDSLVGKPTVSDEANPPC